MKLKLTSFFSPAFLILFPVLFQYLTWMRLDGHNVIDLTPYRTQHSSTLFFYYVSLVLYAAMLGRLVRLHVPSYAVCPSSIRRSTYVIFLLFLAASLVFARHSLGAVTDVLTLDIHEGVNYADMAAPARSATIPGISSFSFASIILVICGIFYYYRYGRSKLIGITVLATLGISTVVAFALGGRVIFLYNVFAAVFVWFAVSRYATAGLGLLRVAIILASAMVILFLLFAGFEYVRKWQNVAQEQEAFIPFMVEYFLVPYVAKNHDNAMILFDTPVHYGLIGSAPFFLRVAEWLGFSEAGFHPVRIVDNGPHGTVLLFALLYQDLGLVISSIAVVGIVFIAQCVFSAAVTRRDFASIALYAVLVPGLLSFARSNYYGNVAFYVNILLLALVMSNILRSPSRARTRATRTEIQASR